MQTLDEIAVQNFESGLVEHLKKFAPKHSEAVTDEGVRQTVRLGIERAKQYDFTNRAPVRFYIELIFMFGSGFDTDPQIAWAGGTLKTDSVSDQLERADLLHDKMMIYLRQVSAAEDYFVASLLRLNELKIEDYAAGGDSEAKIIADLRRIYPQKYEYLGERRLRALVQRGKESAGEHSVTSAKGIALFTALMFTLGNDFAADPLFPWISEILRDKTVTAPNERIEKIYRETKKYLDKAVK